MSDEVLDIWSRSTFLAQNELALSNFDAAREHYIDALNAALALRESAPIYYAQTQVALASLSLLQGDPESSIAFLTDAITIYSATYQRSHYKMLELYHLIANAHHAAGLHEDANYWYQLTLENMAHLPWNDPDKQIAAENYLQLLSSLERAS